MLRKLGWGGLTTLVVMTASMSVIQAQDIELFLTPRGEQERPNILIVLDNSANWNANINGVTKKTMEHQALYEVLTSCELRGGTVNSSGGCDEGTPVLNVGLMTFSKGNSPRGGKVISAVAPLDKAYQDRLAAMIYDGQGREALETTNNAPYAMMLNEVYRYFGGRTPASGIQDGTHDPAAVKADGYYDSPAIGCAKNYALVLGNGEPDSGENNPAEKTLSNLGGRLPDDPISLNPNNLESNWSDEFARFMASKTRDTTAAADQPVFTYVIDVHDHTESDDPSQPHKSDPEAGQNKFMGARAWMASIADQGGGEYFSASSAADIKNALEAITHDLVAKSSVFASTTLPVSVNVRGTHLNQVYMGVFRPAQNASTRWTGNLKLYQLALDYSTNPPSLYLADADGRPIEDRQNGFIVNGARSFWTEESSFWAFAPSGVPPSASDRPDGAVVEKGGGAQRLRQTYSAGRVLYLCKNCSAGSALPLFNTSNVTPSDLGLDAGATAERDKVVRWIAGEDNKDDENKDNVYTGVRAFIHGDVLHSRPAVINYGRYGDDNDIVAFYGGNDGIFRAVKGGKGPTAGVAAGTELWGLVPGEMLDRLKKLRDNNEYGVPFKQYFMDGPIGVYEYNPDPRDGIDAASGDKVYLYIGMRRGGRLIYALDVSDPAQPKLLWKKSSADVGYAELGQTWSLPRAVDIRDGSGGRRPVLVLGAGYDADAEDQDPAAARTMGRGIMVLDAATGEVIWQAGPVPIDAAVNKAVADMRYSIPSDVTVLDINGDRRADRLYVGDTGGQLWRVDINDPQPANWTVHKLASISGTEAADQRKFLYAPDVVWNRHEGYLAVLVGTGDREKPLTLDVNNRFYMFKDDASAGIAAEGSVQTLTESDLYDATDNKIQVGSSAEQDAANQLLMTLSGWYIRLQTGEKVVSNAVSVDGTTVFNTNTPNTTACSQLGIARVYQISYRNATAKVDNDSIAGLTTADRYAEVPGGGLPPSPVPLVVEIDGRILEGISIGPTMKPGGEIKYGARRPTYWHREKD